MTSECSVEQVEIPGGRFHYLSRGSRDAPLVLFLHGFPDQPRSFDATTAFFAASAFFCVTPWMRGYAPSTLTGPYHCERLGRDLLELGDAFSPGRPFYLVGHDWGAIATYAAAARAPERIKAAVALGAPHPATFLHNARRHPLQARRSWYMLFFQLPGLAERAVAHRDFALIDRLWRDWSPGYRASEEHMRELRRCLDESMPAPILYYRALLPPPRIGKVAVPTLYLHGADDGCIPPSMIRGQERMFTGRYADEVLPGCGHFLQLEQPRLVAERILTWFAAC